MISVAVSGYSVQHITYTLVLFFRLALGREVYGGWSPFATYLAFSLAPYLIVCLLYFLIIERPLKQRTEFKEYDLRIALVMLMIIMSNVILSEIRWEGMGQPINQFTSYVVCGLYAIITCSLAIFLQYTIGIENKSTSEKNRIERMLELTHRQYEMSKENIDIINMKCHDLRHQINASRDSLLSQDSQAWAEEVEKSISIYDSTFKSGSSALDVVLTEKSLKCATYKIEFGVIADGKSIDFISPADTYSLFGNIIENAIERLLKEDEDKRYITININKDCSMVLIHVENYCSGDVVFQRGLPVTDKEDKNYHGFGIKSVVYIAEKYGGDAVFKQAKEKFCVDIVFGDK